MRLRASAALVIASLLFLIPATPALALLGWPAGSLKVDLQVERLGGASRYETAVAIARAGWPGWSGMTHVVVASGEDRAFADPLAAGSLCWAYDAPLLLVRGTDVLPVTATALQAIKTTNGGIKIIVVGGAGAVSAEAFDQLGDVVGAENVERLEGANRFDTAAAIAERVSMVSVETSRAVPESVLVANGDDGAGFVDALSLSAVSARTGVPILLVTRNLVPDATRAALAARPGHEVIVAGGTAVVSGPVYDVLGATGRWAGANRYATAVEVAKNARARGWLEAEVAGFAASVPDALAGAISIGRSGGPLLYVLPKALVQPTAAYLAASDGVLTEGRIFGSTGAVSASVQDQLAGAPTQPVMLSPMNAAYLAGKAPFRGVVGVNTAELRLYRNNVLVATLRPGAYSTADFGLIATAADRVTYRVDAVNEAGETSSWAKTYTRLSYPAGTTSIVIDKSEFRLYLVKNDVLVAVYPVATGRPSMETPVRLWKVGAKYVTDPSSVYGPRKMRLYKWTGTTFVSTGYLIHGTNQPWVIGTKASHGCIRLYNSDVLALYPQVPIGTMVQTRE